MASVDWLVGQVPDPKSPCDQFTDEVIIASFPAQFKCGCRAVMSFHHVIDAMTIQNSADLAFGRFKPECASPHLSLDDIHESLVT